MQEVFERIIDQLKAESIIVDDEAGKYLRLVKKHHSIIIYFSRRTRRDMKKAVFHAIETCGMERVFAKSQT